MKVMYATKPQISKEAGVGMESILGELNPYPIAIPPRRAFIQDGRGEAG
jgi:hypothetical protein